MAKRQEQEDAREEVTQVAPDVLRMELPIQMPGLGHVNCYVIPDADGAAVVDPGLPGPATWRAIQSRLKQAELRPRDVHTVIVTHSHPDHFGGAARFADECGARVVAHRSFGWGQAPPDDSEVSLDDLDAQRKAAAARSAGQTGGASPPQRGRRGGPWGGPMPWGGTSPQRGPSSWGGGGSGLRLQQRMRWRWMRMRGRMPYSTPTVSHPVTHGDVLQLAGREWFVLHTPGHTADHVCFHDPENGVFLAGDHVLPTITPHISGLTSSPDPLASFFYSLDRVGEIQGVKQVLPAHGHPFRDLHGRCEAIKRHHYERLDKIRAISRDLGPTTVEEISKRLFAERSWGFMAESETYAHLEHLRLAGDAERREEKGGVIYVTG